MRYSRAILHNPQDRQCAAITFCAAVIASKCGPDPFAGKRSANRRRIFPMPTFLHCFGPKRSAIIPDSPSATIAPGVTSKNSDITHLPVRKPLYGERRRNVDKRICRNGFYNRAGSLRKPVHVRLAREVMAA